MSLALELLYISVWIMRMAARWAVLIFDHKYAKSWSLCTDLERGTIAAWHFWIGCQIIQSVGIWSQLYEIFRFQGLYQFTGTKRFPQCFSYNQVTIHYRVGVIAFNCRYHDWTVFVYFDSPGFLFLLPSWTNESISYFISTCLSVAAVQNAGVF